MYIHGINTTSSSVSSYVTHTNMSRDQTMDNQSSKSFTKTIMIRIKETFLNINKQFRQQKKKTEGKNANLFEKTQEIYLSCLTDLFLLILTPSRPNSVLNRIAIRLSWARNSKALKEENLNGQFTYQVFFVVNAGYAENISLQAESKTFGDIIVMARESQTVISAIDRILLKKCEPKFVLVLGDDNTYVNVPEVASWISTFKSNINYAGSVRQGLAVVVKYPSSTPKTQNVITYCVGGAYILAGKVLKKLRKVSKVILPYNTSETMYIGMLINLLGIEPHHDNRFALHPFEDLKISDIDPCTAKKYAFVQHVFRVRHILMYAKTIVVGKLPCVGMI